jgi:hypothetical protein
MCICTSWHGSRLVLRLATCYILDSSQKLNVYIDCALASISVSCCDLNPL